jgi:hypothetical protein
MDNHLNNLTDEVIMKTFFTIVSCSLLVSLTGCGTSPTKDYQPASPPMTERTAQESGVEVALDPFVERERTKEFFHIDALSEGIAILHVRVENRTADQTFLVQKTNFRLLSGEADADLIADDKKIKRSTTAGNVVGWAGMGGASILLAGGLVSDSTEIQRNFTSKEMGDQSLSPGESMEGFVYFVPVKRGEDWSRDATIKIDLIELRTQKTYSEIVTLAH